MKEILQNSDFSLQIYFSSLSGTNIAPKRFTFLYSTVLSAPIEASFDGINYKNCRAIDGGVLVSFDDPKLNVGQLKVRCTYTIATPAGDRDFTEEKLLNIEIVTSRTKPIEPDDPTAVDLVVIDALKCEHAGINYESPDKTLTGDTFTDFDGNTKPVYTKVFRGVTPNAACSIALFIGEPSTLLDFKGTIETFGGSGVENMPMHFGGAYDWKYYKNANNIEVIIPSSSSYLFQKRYLFSVQYVK